MKKRYAKFNIEVKSVDKEKHTLEAIFSTADEDRHGDKVMQNFDLRAFKKNPVLLNSHNYGDATETIGKIKPISVKDGRLQGKVKFAVAENPKAKIIFDLYAGGYLNTFSIGFIPLEFNDDDRAVIEKSELLEVSAVSVPANARALAKSKGIDIDSLCMHRRYIKKDKCFECDECGYAVDTVDKEELKKDKEESQEKKEIKKDQKKENKELKALKIIAKEKKKREKYILNEVLAVTRRLQRDEVDVKRKRQMVNRAIRQLIKIK